MKIPSLKLRWINYASYEILLPNNKRIVVDPCIDFQKEVEFTYKDFNHVDYIILSHTHYDHTMDIGNILKDSKAKVIVGEMSAFELCKFFDIDFDLMFPVSPNEHFDYDDFSLDVYRGKHTLMNRENNTISAKEKEGFSSNFPSGHKHCDIYGSLEYMNYLITTQENIRILMWGGPKENFYFNNIFDIAKKVRPNLVLKQLSTKYTPEEFAEAMDRVGAQLVFPLHQDGVARKGTITIDEYISRANKRLEELHSLTRVVNPPQYKWIEISMGVDFDE